MNRGIYATATGMLATQRALDAIANNLANASTTGFKRDGLAFGEAYERELRANGGEGPRIGRLGSGVAEIASYTDFEPGPIAQTGNPLDVAIEGQGLFAVATPSGIRYTRDGSFRLDEQGQLVTREGHPVLDDAGSPIQLGEGKVRIDASGEISVDGRHAGRLGLYGGRFAKAGPTLFAGGDAVPKDATTVVQGALEGSNVNAVGSMIDLIQSGRAFELAQRSIQQQDELTQKLIQSLQA
jgi:flagellar basal-body rod protein FlgF